MGHRIWGQYEVLQSRVVCEWVSLEVGVVTENAGNARIHGRYERLERDGREGGEIMMEEKRGRSTFCW